MKTVGWKMNYVCVGSALSIRRITTLAPTYRNKFCDSFASSINQGFRGNCFDKAELETFPFCHFQVKMSPSYPLQEKNSKELVETTRLCTVEKKRGPRTRKWHKLFSFASLACSYITPRTPLLPLYPKPKTH